MEKKTALVTSFATKISVKPSPFVIGEGYAQAVAFFRCDAEATLTSSKCCHHQIVVRMFEMAGNSVGGHTWHFHCRRFFLLFADAPIEVAGDKQIEVPVIVIIEKPAETDQPPAPTPALAVTSVNVPFPLL